MKFTYSILALIFSFVPCCANASDLHSIKNPKEIGAIVAAVPIADKSAPVKNLGDRLRALNWTIVGATVYSYDAKAELERPTDKVGDVHYSIQTTEPTEDFKKRVCDTSGGMVDFMKRGARYYPESRAANWLLTGECSTRFQKPI